MRSYVRSSSASYAPAARIISLRLIKDGYKATNSSPQGIAYDFAMRSNACWFHHFPLWFGANILY